MKAVDVTFLQFRNTVYGELVRATNVPVVGAKRRKGGPADQNRDSFIFIRKDGGEHFRKVVNIRWS